MSAYHHHLRPRVGGDDVVPVRGDHDVHSDRLVRELQDAFCIFDRNGDGHITREELGWTMQFLGQVVTDAELGETIQQLDRDGNGTIELEEFVSLMIQATTASANDYQVEEELRKAFCAFDTDQNGRLSSEELLNVMKSLGEMPSEEEIQNMINQADVDGDGYIDYQEFYMIVMQGN